MKQQEIISKNTGNKKGYQLIIRDLDTFEEVLNIDIRALIGTYAHKGKPFGKDVPCSSIVLTSCDGLTFMQTIDSAEQTVNSAKKIFIKQALKDMLGGEDE